MSFSLGGAVPDEIVYTPAPGDDLKLVVIDRDNYAPVLKLKVAEWQRGFVSSNAYSVAQGHYQREAWFRAVYLKGEPVGFVMLYDPRRATAAAGTEPELPTDGLFVWRLMIDADHQRKGLGRRLVETLAALSRANGFSRLYLSYVEAEGGPGPFYARCGFVETGRIVDGETEARLDLA